MNETAVKDFIDRILNWSGGSYVGLATLTIIGLAVAEFILGVPKAFLVEGKTVIYIVHEAPTWLVGPIGIFTVILAIFAASKPINTYVAQKGTPPPEPAPTPAERPMEK